MQSFQFTPYALLLAIAALISVLLAFYMWDRRNSSGAKPAAILLTALFIWSIGYGLEFLGVELETKLFWAKIQYLGIVTVPIALFLFSLEFSGRREWVTLPKLGALLSIPLITLLLALSNDLHRLIWSEWYLESIGNTLVLRLEHGALFWVYFLYTYILLAVSTVLIFRGMSGRSKTFRRQTVSLLVGIAIPWVGNAISNLDLISLPLDLTPFAFSSPDW